MDLQKKNELINKYTKRIEIDSPEADKIAIDLSQFADEIVKLLNLHSVSGSLPPLTECLNKAFSLASEIKPCKTEYSGDFLKIHEIAVAELIDFCQNKGNDR